ncbi:hypothetical protein [Helicobacter sp. MIT 05-5294]|uniref:hypothetical protein n=1 Tax=Helicobacter sp. MIT 05-5294 TaxID=1548150 RepID=UPI00188482EE|nr:hypothetical protein [Helicobacter sp. MIT 05-5294]
MATRNDDKQRSAHYRISPSRLCKSTLCNIMDCFVVTPCAMTEIAESWVKTSSQKP